MPLKKCITLFCIIVIFSTPLISEEAQPKDPEWLGTWEPAEEKSELPFKLKIEKTRIIMLISEKPLIIQCRPIRLTESGFTEGGFEDTIDISVSLENDRLSITWPETEAATVYKQWDDTVGLLKTSPFKKTEKKGPGKEEKQKLKKELLQRFKKEQDIRRKLMKIPGGFMSAEAMKNPEAQKIAKEMNEIDNSNKTFVIENVIKYGWLTPKIVGGKASQGAFMIALHSAHIRLMQTAVSSLKRFKGKGGQNEGAYAAMADRLALFLGMPMEYGVQATGSSEGMILPVIADREKLNANRKRIGQPPVEEFLKMYKQRGMKLKILEMTPDGFLVEEKAATKEKEKKTDQSKGM